MSFQAVFKAGLLRSAEIKAGEMKFQPLLARRNCQLDGPRRPQSVRVLRLALYQDRFNHYRWRIGVRTELQRIYGNQPFDSGKPERPIVPPASGRLRTRSTFAGGQTIGSPVRAQRNGSSQAIGEIIQGFFLHAHETSI